MGNRYFALLIAVIFFACISCDKDEDSKKGTSQDTEKAPINYLQGLGNEPGMPVGYPFSLPPRVRVIGEIRGGVPQQQSVPYGLFFIDKSKYEGKFPLFSIKNYVTYGTGTYVNLYFQLGNSINAPITVSLPGGLIFCDIQDTDTTRPVYQRGLLLQTVYIPIAPLDTAYVHLPLYCLNKTLPAPNFNVIYTFGPVTANQELNQMIDIMEPKAYPYGEESNLQEIIWNITDYNMALTQEEIDYMNALP